MSNWWFCETYSIFRVHLLLGQWHVMSKMCWWNTLCSITGVPHSSGFDCILALWLNWVLKPGQQFSGACSGEIMHRVITPLLSLHICLGRVQNKCTILILYLLLLLCLGHSCEHAIQLYTWLTPLKHYSILNCFLCALCIIVLMFTCYAVGIKALAIKWFDSVNA